MICGYDVGRNSPGTAETGLDYFGARYFAGVQGRFTSPDTPFGDQDEYDPQSWNLYSYVRNNPLRFTDPTGRACVVGPNGDYDDNSGGESCADVAKNNENLRPSATVRLRYSELALMALQRAGNLASDGSVVTQGVPAAMNVYGMRGMLNWRWWVGQGIANVTRKQGGARTEPNVPQKVIVDKGGVQVVHYTRSGDHGQPHAHVRGGGPDTTIGQNGKPLRGDPELTPTQRQVVEENKGLIRRALDQIGRYSTSTVWSNHDGKHVGYPNCLGFQRSEVEFPQRGVHQQERCGDLDQGQQAHWDLDEISTGPECVRLGGGPPVFRAHERRAQERCFYRAVHYGQPRALPL